MKHTNKEPLALRFISSPYSSFGEVLYEKASRMPEQIAFTYLLDGEEKEANITYRELHKEAIRIAEMLNRLCKMGDRVILSFNPGLDFIKALFGCFYAGIVAVPSTPPKSNRSLERLNIIIKDAGASVIVSHKAVAFNNRVAFLHDNNYRLVNIEEEERDTTSHVSFQGIKGDDLALIQYTSGSTGTAKGVMISHNNLLHNVPLISRVIGQKNEKIVNWLPYYHDMGLISGVLLPVYLGGRGIILSPLHFTQKPLRWLNAITRYGGTSAGGPNFGFELCASSIREEDKTGLDLSSWKVAFVGAEPVRLQTLKNFAKAFSQAGFKYDSFYPSYGMAETTVLISMGDLGSQIKTTDKLIPGFNGQKVLKHVVCCGKPYGFDLTIADIEGNELSEGNIGEILVKGPSVSRGYWNKPQLTKERCSFFLTNNKGPFLRTGDLGFVKEGELYITGRIKDLIIINGRNLYPHDIEATVSNSFPSLVKDACAAFPLDINEQESFVLVCEINSQHFNEAIFKNIQEVIFSEFEIYPAEIVLIRKGTLPKTTSGKIQRYLCKKAFLEKELKEIARSSRQIIRDSSSLSEAPSANNIKEKVIEILSLLTKEKIDSKAVNIFSIGLDSIKLSQFLMLINDEFQVDVPLESIFENPGISSIVQNIFELSGLNKTYETEAKNVFPELTYTQKAIWFHQQLQPHSNSYNIPVILDLTGPVNIPALNSVFNSIVRENTILRTCFPISDNGPKAVVKELEDHLIDVVEVSTGRVPLDQDKLQTFLEKEICKPFAIENAPLFRAKLFRSGINSWKFVFTTHHLIMDGSALFLMIKELQKRFVAGNSTVTPESISAIQFSDFVRWQNRKVDEDTNARTFWNDYLSGNVQQLILPYDHQPDGKQKKSATASRIIGTALTRAITQHAKNNLSTTYIVLQTAFNLLMKSFTGLNEILIGGPVLNRHKREWQALYGVFENTVLFRNHIEEEESIITFLHKVKKNTLKILSHSDHPMEKVIRDIGAPKDLGFFPFTSVFFNGLFFIDEKDATPPFHYFPGGLGLDLNLDMNFYVAAHVDTLHIRLDYKKAGFDPSTIEGLLDDYLMILQTMIQFPEIPVRELMNRLSSVVDAQKEKILALSSGPCISYSREDDLVSLFEKHVLLTPEATALVHRQTSYSYKTVNNKANSLANHLSSKNIGKGDFVAVLMERSPEFLITVMGILKAGAAYVPIDKAWPEERIHLLLSQIKLKAIVFEPGLLKNFTSNAEMIEVHSSVFAGNTAFTHHVDLESPIYGIFTSGSTGVPKCAVNIHKGIINRFLHNSVTYGNSAGHAVLFTARHTFDVSVWQMFWPLTIGARVVFPNSAEVDLDEILSLIRNEKVTVCDFMPSLFNLIVNFAEEDKLIRVDLPALQQVLIGGEMINTKAVRKFRDLFPGINIANTYGPTETSIGTIFYEIKGEVPDIIPIGKPIANVKAVLLNDNKQLVGIGKPGEIYLGGDCIGKGYFNSPELTNEVFLKNFIPELDSEYLYKTGDWGYYLPDGNICITGRKDNQVKYNGYRIELSEIEISLLRHPGIEEVVVSLSENSARNKVLVAYLISKAKLSAKPLRDVLHTTLPEYMIPTYFVQMDKFPLLTNGKTDRTALSLQSGSILKEREEFSLPQNEIEEKLANIWSQILHLEKTEIGTKQNFFRLGGNSLKAIALIAEINREFEVKVSTTYLFKEATIENLSEYIHFIIYQREQLKIKDELIEISV